MVVGNKAEMQALGKALLQREDLELPEILNRVAISTKANARRVRIVVATQGAGPTLAASYHQKVSLIALIEG